VGLYSIDEVLHRKQFEVDEFEFERESDAMRRFFHVGDADVKGNVKIDKYIYTHTHIAMRK